MFIIVEWPNLLFQLFLPRGQTFARGGSAVVPIEPTYVAGPLVTGKFFRSVGSLGLFAYSGEFLGGVDFLGSFPKVGALSLS